MSKITVAEVGWTEYVRDALENALERATKVAADLDCVAMCDAAGCGFMFDTRDPRHAEFKDEKTGTTYQFCPACEKEAQAKATKTKRDIIAKLPADFGKIDES